MRTRLRFPYKIGLAEIRMEEWYPHGALTIEGLVNGYVQPGRPLFIAKACSRSVLCKLRAIHELQRPLQTRVLRLSYFLAA